MKPNSAWRLLTIAWVGGICGCVPGYNSMLFYTNTRAGLVVDTQPPEVNLDIGRQEGLLSPTFEAGKTPPVMASFRFDSTFLNNYLGSTFTTGDAAVAMSRLYDAPDWPEATGEDVWNLEAEDWKKEERKHDSAVAPVKMPWFVPKEEVGTVRPVLFGTDTAFGFKVAWTNPESPLPDYIRLAYQRRELAFAAVTIGPETDDKGRPVESGAQEARVPSLLATVAADVRTSRSANSGFDYLQYFASGRAATALAFRRDVRGAMLKRLDPEQGARIEEADYIYQGNTCPGLRARVRLWMYDETAVDVAALAAAEEAAQTALDDAAVKTGALKKAQLLAKRRHNAAVWLADNSKPLTEGNTGELVLGAYLKDQGSKVVAAPWVITAACEDLERAIDYFAIP